MNCANHPDRERAAFCQNCGKPLCTECIRKDGTSVFCEPCFAKCRTAGVNAGNYGYAASQPVGRAGIPGDPNPGIAALLGFIPGVGAVYNEQYAKGIVHLIVFVVLVSLATNVNGIFGVFVFGWTAYMMIEAHHTARARRDGTTLPNPFGLNDLSERLGFGKAWPQSGPQAGAQAGPAAPGGGQAYAPPVYPPSGAYAPPPYGYGHTPPISQPGTAPHPHTAYTDAYRNQKPAVIRRFPMGAIWLIVLGLFFLLQRTPMFFVHGDLLTPFLLIGFGVWLFVHRMLGTGANLENDGTDSYRWRFATAFSGPFWIVLVGVVLLLNSLRVIPLSRSWPIYIVGAGVFVLLRSTLWSGYAVYPPVAQAPADTTKAVPVAPVQPVDNDQEGR